MNNLENVYKYIDTNLDTHVAKLQEFIRQPSISQTGEGIEKSAKMLRDYIKDLGCEDAKIVMKPEFYSPFVFGEYDANAEKTLLIWHRYDVQPAEPLDEWIVPPFEARLVEMEPFKKVIMARGAADSKSSLMSFLNTLESIRNVAGELPVNLIFMIEGEEERGSPSLPKFIRDHLDTLKRANAVYFPKQCQIANGLSRPQFGSEGQLYVEMECSGARWGRGPTEFGVHGSNQRFLDNPAWRMMHALATITDEKGSKVLIDGWYDNITVPTKEDVELLEKGYKNSLPVADIYDIDLVKWELKVKVFVDDLTDNVEILKRRHFGTSFCLDGIWGGYIGEGGKAFLPTKVTSKHSIRYVPNQKSSDLRAKLRAHLDKHGFNDIEIRKLGGYTWARGDYKTEIAEAVFAMLDEFNAPYAIYPVTSSESPARPAYAFIGPPLNLKFIGGSLGHGGRIHSPNEYYVIESGYSGKYGKVHGLAGTEKSMATVLYNYAGKE